MEISFACKCGKKLKTPKEQAGKHVQCPKCGRGVLVPQLLPSKGPSPGWLIDPSPQAAEKAEQAGIVRKSQASVILLSSTEPLLETLVIEGVFTCWYCKTDIAFSGHVFGRVGLGGAFVTVGCPKCHARIWTGFSSQLTGEGTEIYLYAPSILRGHSASEESGIVPGASAAPSFAIHRVGKGGAGAVDARGLNAVLYSLVQAVTQKQPYQDVCNLAAQLVGQVIPAPQLAGVCQSLRALLDKENTPYLCKVLAEALASVRDEGAGPAIQGALRRRLAEDDPGDPQNLPLHDLCVLALLYGDGNGFLEALDRGFAHLPGPTRACKLRRPLAPKEVADLLQNGESLDSYESTLGGTSWQELYPVLPLWIDEEKLQKEEPRKGWLNRLFRS